MIKSLSVLKYAPLAVVLMAVNVQAKTINKEYQVAEGGKLNIETDRGSIDVESHNKDTVLIEVNIDGKDEDKMEVVFNHSGDNVKIIGDMESSGFNFFNNNSLKVTYTIKVPQHYELDLNTSGGSIEISEINGEIDAHTSGGSISLEHVEGDINVRTSGGSINVEEVSGTVVAHTSGGSINAKLSKAPSGDSKFTTSGGSIKVYLAKDIRADLYAKTSGGKVKSEFTVNGHIKKNSISGTLNGGGPELVFKTSGGSIRIKEI